MGDEMRVLGICGSLRRGSTNAALLEGFGRVAPPGAHLRFDPRAIDLPAYAPDLDAAPPEPVLRVAAEVAAADALVVAVPEYVHALPGAFKNALDWLVPRPELIGKVIGILHASHRGEDVLADLRRVLATVSDGFDPGLFARFAVMKQTPEQVAATLMHDPARAAMQAFWVKLQAAVAARRGQ